MGKIARSLCPRVVDTAGDFAHPTVASNVMRDLSHDRALSSINSRPVKAGSLEQLIEGCARAGLSAISPWRDIVQACGPERAGKLIRAHGMTVTGLCRGGMFPAADEASRRAAL